MLYLQSFLNTGLCSVGCAHFKLEMFASQISLFILRPYEAGMAGIVSLTDVVGHLFPVAAVSRTVRLLSVLCALCVVIGSLSSVSSDCIHSCSLS